MLKSNVHSIALILGYDSNSKLPVPRVRSMSDSSYTTASLFFSGVSTMIFFIVTGGRVPSYLGCSGSFVSIILTISNYASTSNLEMNTNTATVQGAIFVLSLTYAAIALVVMVFGYKWLEFFMPPSK